jgi:hypothetical protein
LSATAPAWRFGARQDAAGREGAFFVHALIWQAGGFPARLLAGLWEADIWVVEPPDDPSDKLAPIQDVEQLGLSAGVPLDQFAVRAALAAHLENLAAARRSSVALAADAALAHAAAIAYLLPAHFGLPAFSTFEEPSRELEYEIVASFEPPRHFTPIAPDAEASPVWTSAAQLLLDARDGDESAAGVVATFTERAADLVQFASELGQWTALETAVAPHPRSGAPGVALAASDPRLLKRAFARFGVTGISRGVADGHSVAAVLRQAAALGQQRAVFEALESELARRAPGEAVPVLARIGTAATDAGAVGRLAARVGEAWQSRKALEELDPESTITLLRLLVPAPSTSVVKALLDMDDATVLIAADEALPTGWRGRAAGANPCLMDADALVALLSASGDAAVAFADRVKDSGLATLAAVLEETAAEIGIMVVDLVGKGLAHDRRSELALPVAERLTRPPRLPAIIRHAPAGRSVDERWGHAILDAYAKHVVATRGSSVELPQLTGAQLPESDDGRFVAWASLLRRLEVLQRSWSRDTELAWAGRTAGAFATWADRDAALELIVDRAADAFGGDGQAWESSMISLALESNEPPLDFADRLARAALRGKRWLPRESAYWTITWVADALDDGSLSSRELRYTPLDHVWARLGRGDVERLTERLRAHRRGSSGRRWLRYNRDKLAGRYTIR